MLIVPCRQTSSQLATALVAWDEGRPAARAVADALPLLAMAARVEIVTVGDLRGDPSRDSRQLVRHLASHGIEAHATNLTRDQGSVAGTLLSHAVDVQADLLVMGGYGHSRLREIVLGGTTRRILQTMTVPVMMAH
ncbi:universal stress protein [Microvirga arsenatis]|uniref:Universal stress protein n=1 Tax=Microvirga arsenatis TaxID=2692265 RepID=A0ABW9Z7E1_9HYPH|nr:universal stress protein [Microvirga arsenatis]NBJ27123.1 universal stress protein [Microvirga arsenatis]